MQRLTAQQITEVATAAGYEPRAIRAILKVETGGAGFDSATGKLLIQFEPSWFKRKLPRAVATTIAAAEQIQKLDPDTLTAAQRTLLKNWQIVLRNGVEGQAREWQAFNAAFAIHAEAAMLSTSWGLPQMMGFNHADLGFASVGAMLDAFKTGEAAQLKGMLAFITKKKPLARAVKAKDWANVAYYYNGSGYKQFKYDRRLADAYASIK